MHIVLCCVPSVTDKCAHLASSQSGTFTPHKTSGERFNMLRVHPKPRQAVFSLIHPVGNVSNCRWAHLLRGIYNFLKREKQKCGARAEKTLKTTRVFCCPCCCFSTRGLRCIQNERTPSKNVCCHFRYPPLVSQATCISLN